MPVTITNMSEAPYGVRTATGGLCFIKPGATRTVEPADPARLARLTFLAIAPAIDLPAPPAGLAAHIDGEDDLRILRAAYAVKLGKRPFPGWDADELKRRMGDE